ncbi:MAG: hypothetical protein ACKO9H_17975 [Planctomycetota bacterium]
MNDINTEDVYQAIGQPFDPHQLTNRRLEQMPPEIGVLMLGFGVAGLIFPGPFGTPLIVAGGLSLWPRSFRRIDAWVAKKMPKSHESGHNWLNRFMDDLEKRYPQGF